MKLNTVIYALIVGLLFGLSASEIVCPVEHEDDSFTIQYPSPNSCSIFYKCNRGMAIMNKCPDGLHYNARIQACDFPVRAKCHLSDII